MRSASFTRRKFLVTTAAASTVFAVPYIVPARAFGANERIITGHIGVGRQGTANLEQLITNAVAVCDVDKKHAAAAAKKVEAKGNTCEVFGDYRKLLERKDIDAVVVTTPDHWHALATIDACNAGKHVYVEKPLSLFVAEGRRMVDAARANKCIVQTGSQQRSDPGFRKACELVRNGRLGKLQTVLVGIPGPNYAKPFVPDGAPPAELDYDMWLGPAPDRPYNVNHIHYNFRFFWDYSGGQMTNFGAHHLDIAQWGLGMDDSGPTMIEPELAEYIDDKRLCEVTAKCRLNYHYSSGAKVVLGQGQPDIPGGCTFIGEKGRIFVERGKITSEPAELLSEPLADDAEKLYASNNHHQNWLSCIKSGELPVADVEIGHRSATVCHLGNIAARQNTKVQWDPATEQIVGNDDAAAMLTRNYRAPWKLA